MTGIDRFVDDQAKLEINLKRDIYSPYRMQRAYHASPAPYRCLGGAAGPGKTLAILMDHMKTCQRFGDSKEAEQVHTLALRRTNPKLEATLVTRFMENIPKELYRKFTQTTPKTVTWRNGATTVFGSMQHEKDAYNWQGQWLKIDYDEMAEFTFKQWNATSAWNRCPVSPYATKGGATNPIGVGAGWIRSLFVDGKPCQEMDDGQKKQYLAQRFTNGRPNDYAYFPCTYLDNPVYANDPTFLKNLMAYPEGIRNALMNGSWDVVGGYFHGAYDPAENCFPRMMMMPEWPIRRWHKRWISGDWGFAGGHFACIYWHYQDDAGIYRTYRELQVEEHDPEQLGEAIVANSFDPDGSMPKFVSFPFSHDAFSSQNTKTMGADPTPISTRMGKVMQKAGLPAPFNAGRNKLGREQGMYNMLRREVRVGTDEKNEPIMRRAWEISEDCPRLMAELTRAPRDEEKPNQIAEYLGDDPLQGAGYGIQWMVGQQGQMTHDDKVRETLKVIEQAKEPDVEKAHMIRLRETYNRQKKQEKGYWE